MSTKWSPSPVKTTLDGAPRTPGARVMVTCCASAPAAHRTVATPSPAAADTPVSAGAVASYCSGKASGELTLPAASVQMPAGAAAPSGPPKVALVQEAIPEVASLPVQPIATGAR